MTHFPVLIITAEEPTEEVLAKVLQPFHEYECTGEDDEYVIDVDKTEEVEADWLKPAAAIRLADGKITERYLDEYYTGDPKPGDISDRKTFVLPEGAEEISIPQHELSAVLGESKEDWAKNYHGYAFRDGKFWRHTNPNAKWDWWVLGGRWKGMLQIKDRLDDHKIGKSGLMDSKHSETGVDSARWGNLDLEAMATVHREKRRSWFAKCMSNAGVTKEVMEHACQTDKIAHAKWMELSEPKPRGDAYHAWCRANGFADLAAAMYRNFEIPDFEGSYDDWIATAPALALYYVIKDGKWYSYDTAGWWGMSLDPKDKKEWDKEFAALIADIDPQHFVSIVDCYI